MRWSKARTEVEPEARERVTLRREPIPSARAILWKPLPDSYHLLASMMRGPEQQIQLFITQRAFLQVEQHLASAPDLELGGFLAGHRYECPRTRTQYSIVNTTVPFAEVTGDPLGARVTERAYTTARRRLDAHGLSLIGWYRNGSGLGLQLLPDDIETHLAYFHEPWQTTMLVLPDASKPRGGFFTYDPRVGRSYCIPFHELLNTSGADAQRPARTVVAWKSYVASLPVQPMPAEDREVAATTVRPTPAAPEPEPPDPIDEWWEAIKDPWVRLKDVAVSATRQDEELPGFEWDPAAKSPQPVPVELPRPLPGQLPPKADEPTVASKPSVGSPNGQPKAPTRPAVPPFAGPVVPSLAGPAVPPFAGSARPRPEPLINAPVIRSSQERPDTARASSAAEAPSSAAPRRSTTPKPRPIPAATKAAMASAGAPLVVVSDEPEQELLRWRRWRRIGLAVAAASFLAAIVLASVRPRPEQVAQAATADSMNEAADSGVETATGTNDLTAHGAPLIPLSAAVDSLSAAIAHYREVENDHRRGRVGCRALMRAHDGVLQAHALVGISRGALDGSLGAVDSLRVSMTRAEYTHVSQLHRRSGCQG